MYRKGLIPARIAELCGALPRTVGWHLRVERGKQPDLLAEHLANRLADNPRPPSPGRLANVDALAEFRRMHGRYPPAEDQDPASRRLSQWLAEQRRADRADKLPKDRRQILATLPGWDVNQRAKLDARRWKTRAEDLRAFRKAEGHFRTEHPSQPPGSSSTGSRSRLDRPACVLSPHLHWGDSARRSSRSPPYRNSKGQHLH